MSLHNLTKTSPAAEPSPTGGKVKKTLVVALTVGGAISAYLFPLLVSASFFSALLQRVASPTDAEALALNSQTMPVLAAATNIDPNPAVGGGDISVVDGAALMPQEGPSGTAADIESKPTNAQISVYTVHDGDTLSGIAALFGVTTNTIIGANNIKGGVIHPGQQLIILPIAGIQHTVVKGETLASLAQTYHSDAAGIAQYNDLGIGDALVPGQVVIIPGGEVGTPANAVSSSQSSEKSKPSRTSAPKVVTKPKTTKGFVPAKLRDAGGPDYGDYYAWPVDGGIITQSLHGYNGVDIGAPTGTDIYASAAGTVIIAKDDGGWNGGYGNYIVVQHTNGTQTLYAHASRVLVSAGESVSQGELIAKVGRTGEATGPHLHFEVRGATNPFGAIPVGSGD